MNDRDPDFAEKAVAIIELLLNPSPMDGPLFCVDEKTGIGSGCRPLQTSRGAWRTSASRIRVRATIRSI